MKSILGKKLGMTRIFDNNGNIVPITVIEAGPCKVTAIQTEDRNGYSALQLGFDNVSEKNVNKPQRKEFKNNKIEPKRFLKEIRGNMFIKEKESDGKKEKDNKKKVEQNKSLKVGDEVKVNIFDNGDFVDITGISKGKGFQGGVKKWGWSIGPKSHGSRSYRAPGSIGASADPSRVVKGKNMAGRMGGKITTVKNIRILKVNEKENIMIVKGCVPGSNKSYLVIRESYKKRNDKK